MENTKMKTLYAVIDILFCLEISRFSFSFIIFLLSHFKALLFIHYYWIDELIKWEIASEA